MQEINKVETRSVERPVVHRVRPWRLRPVWSGSKHGRVPPRDDRSTRNRMPPKMYFLFYLRTQILPIDSYVLNSKSAAFQSIWLKFGQSDAIYLFYKTVSANFNTPFHFKARAFFPQGVLTNCLPQLHSLKCMTKWRTHAFLL